MEIRIAAAGDVHASEMTRDALEKAFDEASASADLIVLAGDLTLRGEVEEAQVVADAARRVPKPVCAVLGNHDYHQGHEEEIGARLEAAGVLVLGLKRSFAVLDVDGVDVGVVGTKGFVGGFPGSSLPDFGEPELRRVYAATSKEVSRLEEGLQGVSHSALRLVLLHYAPVLETLEGEPVGIHTYLGSARLALPIAEYQPDLVVHGHAHAGSFEGRVGDTPVYNVSVHVTGRDFYVFDLDVAGRGHAEVAQIESPA